MSTYATKKMFGGRRARVGAIVLLAGYKHDRPESPEVCLRSGRIVAISASKDCPYILDERYGTTDFTGKMWTFVETKTEADVLRMTVGQWTWPPPLPEELPAVLGESTKKAPAGAEADCG